MNREPNRGPEQGPDDPDERDPASNVWRPLLLVAVLLALFMAARYFDLGERLTELRAWIDDLGAWGPLAFIAIYILATVAMIPGSGPTMIAGGLFGSLWGTVYVSIASTTGAALCFLIARYMARGAVSDWLEGQERFQKLDRLTETHGGWIVAITRLVPVFPFNLLNYGFGLTRVRFWTYVGFSWLCMLPGTLLYVAGTDAVVQAMAAGRIPWAMIALLVVLLGALVGIGVVARRKLRSAEEEAGVRSD